MLPYYSIFDNLKYRVDGSTVTLGGQVITLGLKRDAETAVKGVEGVTKVVNQIEELPPFSDDQRIREAVARRIFSFGSLSRYGWEAAPSIHIIVKSGHVTLEGVVDNESDKNAAGIQANGVPGIFSVQNNLQVAKR
jgi:hyperosmotically inducible protein